ncbi:MAG: nucleoside triphosphate pyrophosphohydrolase [Rhodospirillales bacterium]|nr:nucleoside triphosphate pyrophosphohydrolase [Rhodospirillales bacterium]
MTTQIDKLISIMAQLRDPENGCPWDLEQDFSTIAPHTIEEAYEVADAIEKNDLEELKDELGDLLFQVIFYSQMAKEIKAFDFESVVQSINEKMIRRHPHIFGDTEIKDAESQTKAWEEQKASERQKNQSNGLKISALEGVINGLPALTRAAKLQKRAARVGFDWPDTDQIFDKINEEIEEIHHELDNQGSKERVSEEVGDLLFACVNLARKLDIDPETSLRLGNSKFEKRFRRMEALMDMDLEGKSLDEMEAHWQQVKKEEVK